MRESLLELCQEIGRSMAALEARLAALGGATVAAAREPEPCRPPLPRGCASGPPERGGAHAPPRHATAGAPRARRPEDHRRGAAAAHHARGRAAAAARPADHRGHVPLRGRRRDSSWCDLLVKSLDEFDWQVLPIVAPHGRPPLYELPAARARGRAASRCGRRTLPRGPAPAPERAPRRRRAARRCSCAACSAGTATTTRCVDAFVWCRRIPPACAARSARAAAGTSFLCGAAARCSPSASRRPARRRALDLVEAAQLYQTLYWVARTAAVPTPATDVLHVTAAGWSAIPALVHKALHGTPMVLTEHGVYVREAYLAAVRSGGLARQRASPPRAWRAGSRARRTPAPTSSRPVTDANAVLGAGASASTRRRSSCSTTACASRRRRRRRRARAIVVSVGRIDPLKDVHTMLRVAAGDAAARARRAVPPLRAGDRRARRPTAARATRCTSSSGSATASASWAARRTPTASCATPTWC